MVIHLVRTIDGFKPCFDDDWEKMQKVPVGKILKTNITIERNFEFHKKYFALIHCAWEYLNEDVEKFFKGNIDQFRKTVEIAAGHYDSIYNIEMREWVQVPKSIAFDKMDEIEFKDLYERVKDVLFAVFLKNVSEEEFKTNLADF